MNWSGGTYLIHRGIRPRSGGWVCFSGLGAASEQLMGSGNQLKHKPLQTCTTSGQGQSGCVTCTFDLTPADWLPISPQELAEEEKHITG